MLKISDLAFSYSNDDCKVFNDFSLKRMQRLDVVPASSAMIYLAIGSFLLGFKPCAKAFCAAMN